MDDSIEDLIKLAKRKKGQDGNKNSKKVKLTESHEEHDPTYPYAVFADDHCETPLEAYQDISNFLHSLAVLLGKSAGEIAIYDPFYCEGSVVTRLNSLGFKNVHNVKEDFYSVCSSSTFPDYDVIVTNPPYSGSHMEHILKVCIESGKPWFLLLPNYVYMKDYYEIQTRSSHYPFFYVTPASKRRYQYTTPKGRRQEKSGKYTAPFPTFWYCCVQKYQRKMLQYFDEGVAQKSPQSFCVIKSTKDIPLELAPDNDPRKKKIRNSQKRSKNKKRKKSNAAVETSL